MKISQTYLFVVFTCFVNSLFSQDVYEKVMHARTLYAQEKYTEALSVYTQLNQLYPKPFDVTLELAQSAYRASNFQEAEKQYQNYLDLHKEEANLSNTFYNLGNVKWKLNKTNEAIEAYKNALRKDPSNSNARFNLAKLTKKLAHKKQPSKSEKGKTPTENPTSNQTSNTEIREEELNKSVLSNWKTDRILDQLMKAEMETKKKIAKKKIKSGIRTVEKDW